jgi:hypothetical protein
MMACPSNAKDTQIVKRSSEMKMTSISNALTVAALNLGEITRSWLGISGR